MDGYVVFSQEHKISEASDDHRSADPRKSKSTASNNGSFVTVRHNFSLLRSRDLLSSILRPRLQLHSHKQALACRSLHLLHTQHRRLRLRSRRCLVSWSRCTPQCQRAWLLLPLLQHSRSLRTEEQHPRSVTLLWRGMPSRLRRLLN